MKWYKLMFAFAVNVILNLVNDCHLILLAIRYQFRSSDEGRPDSRRRIVRSPSFVKSLPSQVYEIDEKGKLQEQVRIRIILLMLEFHFCCIYTHVKILEFFSINYQLVLVKHLTCLCSIKPFVH